MRGYRHQITQWKSTNERYVAILQAAERFEPQTLRELKRGPDEAWVIGRLKGSTENDIYAIGLNRVEMEYEEARDRARAAVDHINALVEQGKDPFR